MTTIVEHTHDGTIYRAAKTYPVPNLDILTLLFGSLPNLASGITDPKPYIPHFLHTQILIRTKTPPTPAPPKTHPSTYPPPIPPRSSPPRAPAPSHAPLPPPYGNTSTSAVMGPVKISAP
jgi:hypothetical protein